MKDLNSTSVQTQTLVSSSEQVLLQIIIVRSYVPVQSGDKTEIVLVKVLLDSASHHSFITVRLAKQLKGTRNCCQFLYLCYYEATSYKYIHMLLGLQNSTILVSFLLIHDQSLPQRLNPTKLELPFVLFC